MSKGLNYLGRNVHAYTREWKALADDPALREPVSGEDWRRLLWDIECSLPAAPHQIPCLGKFGQLYREANGGYTDAQFGNVNVSRLLLLLWRLVVRIDDPSTYRAFRQTLVEVGMTCVQGDSHRLFADWFAFSASLEKEKETSPPVQKGGQTE